MYIYIFIIVCFVCFVLLFMKQQPLSHNVKNKEEFSQSDLDSALKKAVDFTTSEKKIKEITDGLFSGVNIVGKGIEDTFKTLGTEVVKIANVVGDGFVKGANIVGDGFVKGANVVGDKTKAVLTSKTPGKKPCSNWNSRYRDDNTSCWLDTYGRGVGRDADWESCGNGKDVWGTCWEDYHNYSGGCGTLIARCHDGSTGCKGDCYKSTLSRVSKNIGDRARTCRSNEDIIGALCYPKCDPGYHAVSTVLLGNYCEPDGGSGIKVTAFDRYECPPPGSPDHINLKDGLCYEDPPEIKGKKEIEKSNGQSIKCNTDVYRVENNKLRWYPSEKIANSWDTNWKNAKLIADCSAVERSNDMRYKSEDQLDDAIKNNKSVTCGNDVNVGSVYRVENRKLRWYPSAGIAGDWDSNWSNSVKIDDCTITSRGDDMKYKEYPAITILDPCPSGSSDAGDCRYPAKCTSSETKSTWNACKYRTWFGCQGVYDYEYIPGKCTESSIAKLKDDRKITGYNCPPSDKPNHTKLVGGMCAVPVVVPPPNLKNNDIFWQRVDYNWGDLNWMNFSDSEWNKYYKISCKNTDNEESSAKGPFGPVTGNVSGYTFNYPNIRLSDNNVSPCGNNKVTIYRSNSRDGPYIDISDDPRLLNRANNAKYNRFDAVFTDNVPKDQEANLIEKAITRWKV